MMFHLKFVILFCVIVCSSCRKELNKYCWTHNIVYNHNIITCDGLNIRENTTYNDVFNFPCYDCSVIITNSHIPVIEEGMLARLSGVRYWKSPKVGLSRIDGLIDFNKAEMLDLSQNKLQNVSGGVFKRLIGLINLDLSYNELTELELGTFEGLEKLIILNLKGNEIKSLSENVFNELKNLKNLDLSENSISDYSKDIFSHNIQLKYLFFRRAFANQFSLDIFGKLKELETLDVSQNNVKFDVGSFAEMRKLQSLNLSSTIFEEFQYGQFTSNKLLKTLDLSSNEMISFDTKILAFLSILTELYLHNNKLDYNFDYPQLESNRNLRLITLSDNNWSCGFLTEMVENFYHRGIKITVFRERLVTNSTNVEGIMCTVFY